MASSWSATRSVALTPLVVDEILGSALEPGVVAPLMTAEQRLHQITARHGTNLLGNDDTRPRARGRVGAKICPGP